MLFVLPILLIDAVDATDETAISDQDGQFVKLRVGPALRGEDSREPAKCACPSPVLGPVQDRVVSLALSWSRRRLSSSLRESQYRQIGICTCLRQRMGTGCLREAQDQMCFLYESALSAGN